MDGESGGVDRVRRCGMQEDEQGSQRQRDWNEVDGKN